jgi:hypothetical protein
MVDAVVKQALDKYKAHYIANAEFITERSAVGLLARDPASGSIAGGCVVLTGDAMQFK